METLFVPVSACALVGVKLVVVVEKIDVVSSYRLSSPHDIYFLISI